MHLLLKAHRTKLRPKCVSVLMYHLTNTIISHYSPFVKRIQKNFFTLSANDRMFRFCRAAHRGHKRTDMRGTYYIVKPSLCTVRHWRTSVFTKNTIVQVRYLALLSIDFSRKMGYNCYCDKNNDPRGKYYIIKER